MEVTTGIIYSGSWQKILKYLPNRTLAGNEEQYKEILSNLIQLYDVLTNILQPIEDTMRRIIIDDTDLEY